MLGIKPSTFMLLALLTSTTQAGQPATAANLAAYATRLLDGLKIAGDTPGSPCW